MYLVQKHHEGIVERKTFDAVQAEMARRSAGKSPSKKNAPTGMTSYASKYALSERLVCGECGTLYRRCTWSKQGRKPVSYTHLFFSSTSVSLSSSAFPLYTPLPFLLKLPDRVPYFCYQKQIHESEETR